MRFEWHLESIALEEPLHLIWDTETGALSGSGAARVQQMIEMHLAVGSVPTHPCPSSIDIADPLHNMTEMAAILGNEWKLPKVLRSRYPKIKFSPSRGKGPQQVY